MLTKTRIIAILTVLAIVLVACNISTTGKTRQPVVRSSTCETAEDCSDTFRGSDVWCTSQSCVNGACEYEDTCGWMSTCCVDTGAGMEGYDPVWCNRLDPFEIFGDPCEDKGEPAIP